MRNSQLFEALLTQVCPIWAWPFWGWPEKTVKYVENTRRYTLSTVFFSCFTSFFRTNTVPLGNLGQALE